MERHFSFARIQGGSSRVLGCLLDFIKKACQDLCVESGPCRRLLYDAFLPVAGNGDADLYFLQSTAGQLIQAPMESSITTLPRRQKRRPTTLLV